MIRRTKWAGLMLAATLAMSACSESKPEPAKTVSAAPAAPAPAGPAGKAEDVFVGSGPLVVENQVDVMAQREGVVARIVADVGGKVAKGQLLAQLDDRQLSSDLDAARARHRALEADVKSWESLLKVYETDLERAEEMRKADLNTQQQLDHARYRLNASQHDVERERQNYRNAQASLRSLELELEKTRILAPFAGVVARRYVRAGQKVAVGERLFWVTAVAPVRVRFTLPESFVGKVRVGTEVSVTAAFAPDEKHPAKVVLVSPVVDPSSGTIEVLAELTGPLGELRPGMTAQVRLVPRP